MNCKKVYYNAFCAFILSTICMWSMMFLNKVFPFGYKTNLIWDGLIQYIDYFAYLKNVMSGICSIDYSFTKSLGGSCIAIFGYYLSSPLNLLLPFFKQENLQQFVFVITSIKIGLCGAFFSFYIEKRLPDLKRSFVLIAALAYGFTQYTAVQLPNINWLDGVYMLPLLALATWNYISGKSRGTGIYIGVALSIIFNWYTAYMNCLFLVIYFIFEQYLWNYRSGNVGLRRLCRQIIKFCSIEFLSVLLSSAFFLPVVLGQGKGRSAFDTGIFKFDTNGSFLDIFRGFILGSDSPGRAITLFFGTLLLVLIIAYFMSGKVDCIEKKCSAIFLLTMISCIFFTPLEHVWCGFKFENSYAYRFSYVIIFALIFVSIRAVAQYEEVLKEKYSRISLLLAAAFLYLDQLNTFGSRRLWLQMLIICMYVIILKMRPGKVATVVMVVAFMGEITLNGFMVTKNHYNGNDQTQFSNYTVEQKRLITALRESDSTAFYRMDQTMNRDMNYSRNSFFANESMTFGYSGIQHYSSAYDENTAGFLKSMGYCEDVFPTFYHEPILAADSLLGVKYLLSDRPYEKYIRIDDIEPQNGKHVYLNPYAMPLGFRVPADAVDFSSVTGNPFEFQNQLYSGLLGRNVQLFYQVEAEGMELNNGEISYQLPGIEREGLYYGYISNYVEKAALYINDEYYADCRKGWTNSGIFNIGTAQHAAKVTLKEISENTKPEMLMYFFDFHEFENAISELKRTVFQADVFEDGQVKGTINMPEDGYVLLTVPYDSQWKIKINGEPVQALCGMRAFTLLPVKKGENNVIMSYYLQGKMAGGIVSILSIGIWTGGFVYRKRKKYEKACN